MLRFCSRVRDRVRRAAQSTTEYVIILALVAIGSIGIITIFGNQIRELFRHSAREAAGDTADEVQDRTGGAAGEVDKGLDDF